MRFRIDLAEPVPSEVQRLLIEQIDHARDGLLAEGASESAVHEARKSCKRTRATVALVGGGLRAQDRRRLDRAFRDAARHIGLVRDSDVMRHTLASLRPDATPPEPIADREPRAERTVRALDLARALVSGQNLSGVSRHTLVEGLVTSWRGARGALDEAQPGTHPEAFHEWRKSVKRVLYHVQILIELHPTVMAALASQLDVLQEALGDHHDLHVLAANPSSADSATRRSLEKRGLELERRTVALGAWVLSAPARQLRRWVTLVG